MIEAILDTTVILHLFRKYPPALQWLNLPRRYAVTSVTWLEVMEGTSNKANQAQFELVYLTSIDQQWAMEQLERYQFSHHIGLADCLIASIAHRMQLPLYTHNLKDMTPLVGSLAIRPYT